jgi:hypothetical protein
MCVAMVATHVWRWKRQFTVFLNCVYSIYSSVRRWVLLTKYRMFGWTPYNFECAWILYKTTRINAVCFIKRKVAREAMILCFRSSAVFGFVGCTVSFTYPYSEVLLLLSLYGFKKTHRILQNGFCTKFPLTVYSSAAYTNPSSELIIAPVMKKFPTYFHISLWTVVMYYYNCTKYPSFYCMKTFVIAFTKACH